MYVCMYVYYVCMYIRMCLHTSFLVSNHPTDLVSSLRRWEEGRRVALRDKVILEGDGEANFVSAHPEKCVWRKIIYFVCMYVCIYVLKIILKVRTLKILFWIRSQRIANAMHECMRCIVCIYVCMYVCTSSFFHLISVVRYQVVQHSLGVAQGRLDIDRLAPEFP